MREIKNAVVLAVILCVLLSFFAIAANAQSTNAAVCKISAGGSGTFIGVTMDGTKGLVISCNHVCGGHDVVRCYFNNAPGLAGQPYNGRVFKLDRRWDLAAVLIHNPGFPPAAIGDFRRHEGNYFACGYGGGRYSAAIGPVYQMDDATVWTRGGIYPGHSGGGLFDPYGRWCGVTNWNNGSRGPNNGFAKCRAGTPLQQFVEEASYQCGVLSRLRGRVSGGGDPNCPDGNCPKPSSPGNYGLAPEYKPLTPLASAPQVTPPQAMPLATVPPTTQAAPVPQQAVVVTPAKPAEPANPMASLAAQFAAINEQMAATAKAKREESAAAAAFAAYQQAMTGHIAAPVAAKLPTTVESTEREPARLVTDLPIVTMKVEYREADGRVRVESAELDLANFVRSQFGLGDAEKE